MTSVLDPSAARADAPADPMVPRPYVVTRTNQDTRDTYTLAFEPLEGDPLTFEAGQFTMLHAFGIGEAPISIIPSRSLIPAPFGSRVACTRSTT